MLPEMLIFLINVQGITNLLIPVHTGLPFKIFGSNLHSTFHFQGESVSVQKSTVHLNQAL